MPHVEIREPTFLILTALAGGRKHGYAIIKETEELSKGRVRLKVGTLYAALGRLEAQGLVRLAGEETVDGRLRRYFELDDEGSAALGEEIERMESNASAARARIRGASRASARAVSA